MTFAEAFKTARLTSGLTQKVIRKLIRLNSAQFISNWERSVSYPTPSQLQKICRTYGWDYNVLSALIVAEKANRLAKRWIPKQRKKKDENVSENQ